MVWSLQISHQGALWSPTQLKLRISVQKTQYTEWKSEREGENNLTEEKPDKHYCSPVIKVNIHSDKPC